MAEEQEQEKKGETPNIIIIKKKKVMGHGHHGGAWKIAYADFVTAMMAFFLLMWLLNSTSEEQKRGIADFFAPISVFESEARTGGTMGSKSVSVEGAFDGRGKPTENVLPKAGVAGPEQNMSETDGEIETDADGNKNEEQELIEKIITPKDKQDEAIDIGKNPEETSIEENEKKAGGSDIENEDNNDTLDKDKENDADKDKELTEEEIIEEYKKLEEQEFAKAEEQLIASIHENGLNELADNLVIEQTKDGLRIQIVDQDKRPMFALGSADMPAHTRALIEQVAKIIIDLDKKVSISGHTDAKPFNGRKRYSNWELSADRANSSRRTLEEFAVPTYLFERVIGMADKEPFIIEDHFAARNRRVSITILREDEIAKILGEMAKEIPAYKAPQDEDLNIKNSFKESPQNSDRLDQNSESKPELTIENDIRPDSQNSEPKNTDDLLNDVLSGNIENADEIQTSPTLPPQIEDGEESNILDDILSGKLEAIEATPTEAPLPDDNSTTHPTIKE